MAKILFSMDTNDKTFQLTIDGEVIDNVVCIQAYDRTYDTDGNSTDDDLCHVEIVRREPESDGMYRTERICASEAGLRDEELARTDSLSKAVSQFMAARRQGRGVRLAPRG